MRRLIEPGILVLIGMMACCAVIGCARQQYFPDRAAEPYPVHLHHPNAVDIQVFREGTKIEMVNATAESYIDFNLWINKRYVKRVDALRAGETKRFSLWEFYDERGEVMNAGGFFRVREPDPVRIVQIQVDDESPLIGLITVREDPLEERDRLVR